MEKKATSVLILTTFSKPYVIHKLFGCVIDIRDLAMRKEVNLINWDDISWGDRLETRHCQGELILLFLRIQPNLDCLGHSQSGLKIILDREMFSLEGPQVLVLYIPVE